MPPKARPTSSRTGRAFDREIADYLRNRGYLTVKSAGSKTCVDVAAFPVATNGPVLIVQGKAGAGRITTREWLCLLQVSERSTGCVVPLVALRVDSRPVFYRILGPLLPRTKTENLPWELFSI